MNHENKLSGTGVGRKSINILCFSHLRWEFVYQRPQHLLARASAHAKVYFFEEPVFEQCAEPRLQQKLQPQGVEVLTPILPHDFQGQASLTIQETLVDRFITERGLKKFIAWYYTPMAMLFTGHLRPQITVYDCMDQLSAFQGAPAAMVEQEAILFAHADLVFTGGRSLYEAKRTQHHNVHAFPSSVDHAHFGRSRLFCKDPDDQASIPHPRIGFFGVLDERLDRELIRDVAARMPEWQLILIGPIVKIREDELPRAANIHYLGPRPYAQLPDYLAHWDVTMLPFALNESTRFISPTKTPEYLAAGKPVVSTQICDVVEPYGRLGLAHIVASAEDFCRAVTTLLDQRNPGWLASVDKYLSHTSWDRTFEAMWHEVLSCKHRAARVESDKSVDFDYLIAGAGSAGNAPAERLVSQS